MPDLTTGERQASGPVLRLPDDLVRVAEIVAAEYAGHAQHTLDQAAAGLRERAARLRRAPLAEDPVASALKEFCHSEAGLLHAHPSVVAAAAYEAVAALLEAPASNEKEEESRG